MTDRRPFRCDLDRGEQHLQDADRAYRQGRTVVYFTKTMPPFVVKADPEELRDYRAQRR